MSGHNAPKLGLIAGGGALPLAIAARCEVEGRPLFVILLSGCATAGEGVAARCGRATGGGAAGTVVEQARGARVGRRKRAEGQQQRGRKGIAMDRVQDRSPRSCSSPARRPAA